VKIENLTDVEYEEVLGYASPSRRAVVGVRYSM
jgi:outer membrane cobalamin receptor